MVKQWWNGVSMIYFLTVFTVLVWGKLPILWCMMGGKCGFGIAIMDEGMWILNGDDGEISCLMYL